MSDQLITSVVTLATAVIGVAIIAVILSKKSATADVLKSGGSAFASVLNAALSPINGNTSFSGASTSLSLPSFY